MDQPREDGTTLRQTFESVERQTGRAHPRLEEAGNIPLEFQWHYLTWGDISSGRSSSGMGATPLTWLDLQAYVRLMRVPLTPFDIQIIRAIDGAWFKAYADERERQDKARERRDRKGNR